MHFCVPWLPVAGGRADARLTAVAAEIGASPMQVALAWLLHRSPVMLPIPGTASVPHLEENVAAGELRLEPQELDRLAAAA